MIKKILFEVCYDEDTLIKESLNGEQCNEHIFQIKNSPIYAYGVSFDDIIRI